MNKPENSFQHQNATGKPGEPSSIALNVRLSHALIPPHTPQTLWALIELEARPVPSRKNKRIPINIGLVLDRSGSMSGEPLEYVKKAARFVVDHMGPEDKFSLTVFDDQVETIVPQAAVTNKELIRSLINQIQPGGSTNLSGGFLRGCQEVMKETRSGQSNRVVLLTDGMANVGITDPSLLAAKAQSMAEKGLLVSAVGVGREFNEDLLIAMCEAGRGNYYYVKNADEIPTVFAKEMRGLLKITAQNVRVTLRSETGKVVGVIGYEQQVVPGSSPEAVVLNLPDMYENEKRILVAEIFLPPLPHSRPDVLAVTVDYADSLRRLDSVSIGVSVSLPVAEGPEELYQPDVTVTKVVELTRTAVAKDRAVTALDNGNWEEGRSILQERLNSLRKLAQKRPDPDIVSEVRNLESLLSRTEPDQPLFDTSYTSEIRKELRYQSYLGRRKTGADDEDNC
ncbi:MAG: VWA domain-containing protein [Firmicutes bacterium]|nr:VWA domain-containing protein [Candidatus Fermentithermobacillaceae bacterium]